MRIIITAIVCFVLGVCAGAYRGIAQTKNKVVNLATELYQSGLESTLNTSGTVSNELKTALQQQMDNYMEQFKSQAKDQASEYLKVQIDEIFR